MHETASRAPETSAFIRIVIEKLVPVNEVAVWESASARAQKLLEFSFDPIFFTGSATLGKVVMTAAAQNMTSFRNFQTPV